MISNHTFNESEYLDFFGLNFNPFPVTPDADNFYSTRQNEQIVVEIIHGIITRKGFMVITGEVGLGKTTISRKILNILSDHDIESSVILHPIYKNIELLKEINNDFGIQCDGSLISDQMDALSKFLIHQNRLNKNCVIIIDDAQNLTFKNFELLRMLSNLESKTQKLVQILLIGQPELSDLLNSHKLRQLKSRIIINKEALPLNKNDIIDYITYKLNASGNSGTTGLSGNAANKIVKFTRGNFRSINILMDRCLYSSFLNNSRKITKKNISEAILDLNQSSTVKTKREYRYYATIPLILILLISSCYYFLRESVFIQTANTAKNITPSEQTVIKPEILTDNSKKINTDVVYPPPIVDFLTSYNLSNYQDKFYNALKTNNFQILKDDIYADTDLLLIRLNNVPDYIKNKFNVLAFPGHAEKTMTYYLFIKPAFRIKDFYYSYKGEEIGKLQAVLAKVNLYKYRQDSIVGKRMMLAVLKFQKKMNIPRTGIPDDTTVFLLTHYKNKV